MSANDDVRAGRARGTIAQVLAGEARWAVECGDCLAVMPTLPARSVAHVITDPPYSEHVHGKQRRMLRGVAGAGVGPAELGFVALDAATRAQAAQEFANLARRWVLAFTNAEGQSAWEADLVTAGLRHIRVGAWVKLCAQPQLTGDRPAVGFEAVEMASAEDFDEIEIAHSNEQRCRWNNGGHPAVWTHAIATDRNGTGDRVHTTQKPVSLMLELVEQFTDPDEVVLDAFAGSGTTGVACLRLGRRFIGIERDAKYAAIARERLAAESQGLTLRAARAGQLSLLGDER